MKTNKKIFIFSFSFFACGLVFFLYHNFIKSHFKHYDTVFIKTISDVDIYTQSTKNKINELVKKIIETNDLHFSNTFKVYDEINQTSQQLLNIYELYLLVGTNNEIKKLIQEKQQEFTVFALNAVSFNKQLYEIMNTSYHYIKNNMHHNPLSKIEKTFMDDVIRSFKREGIHLNEDLQEKLKTINGAIDTCKSQFEINLQKDKRGIWVSDSELEGVNKKFIENLKKNDEGLYYLPVNAPTRLEIMQHCKIEETRKKYYQESSQLGYPDNEKVLTKLQQLTYEKAQILGYPSYAAYEIEEEMAERVDTVEKFIDEIDAITREKALQEKQMVIDYIKSNHNEYTNSYQEPYNAVFLWNQYEKNQFNVENHAISHYFPLDQTIDKLLQVYETFFGITFKRYQLKNESWTWSDDLIGLEVFDTATQKKLGTIIIDLYIRDNKNNDACMSSILAGIQNRQEPLSVLVCNFQKSTSQQTPTLMKISQVRTFFHEFGHALHHTFGVTQFASHSGTNTSLDFVEIPSQLFEQWLIQASILKTISSHFETQQQLPDEHIESILQSHHFGNGISYQRQLALSKFSLGMYTTNIQSCDHLWINKLKNKIQNETISLSVLPDYDHSECSFGHLTAYGSKYYSYQWSIVRALDIFKYIKENNGILNESMGKRLRECILSKGDSEEYKKIIEDFLGRPMSLDAFKEYIHK
jgi:thimet oligopeptidase